MVYYVPTTLWNPSIPITTVDAERIIKAGGFYINLQRITDPLIKVCDADFQICENLTLVRVGEQNKSCAGCLIYFNYNVIEHVAQWAQLALTTTTLV